MDFAKATDELDEDLRKECQGFGSSDYIDMIRWEQRFVLLQIMRHLKTLVEYEEGKH